MMTRQSTSPNRRLPIAARAAVTLAVALAGACALAAEESRDVAEWVRKLDDASYRVRERAQERLIELGEAAEAAVAAALKSGSVEVQMRARLILTEIHRNSRLARTESIRKSVMWHRPIEGGGASGPVLSHGVAVTLGGDRKLHGVDAKTGRQVWVSSLTGLLGQPQADAGMVFAMGGSSSRSIQAFDARQGKLTWRREIEGQGTVHVLAVGGVVYAGGKRLVALDAKTGETRWEAPLPKPVAAPVVVAGEFVYVAQADGKIRALDKPTGRALWEMEALPSVPAAKLAVGDGVLYAMGPSSVVAIDLAQQKARWKHSLPRGGTGAFRGVIQINGRWINTSAAASSLQLAGDVLVVWRGGNSPIRALALATGKPSWTFLPGPLDDAKKTGAGSVTVGQGGAIQLLGAQGAQIRAGRVTMSAGVAVAGGPASLVVAEGVIYCPTTGALRAVAVQTGTELWRLPIVGGPTSPVVADGVLYCGARLGQLPVRMLPQGLVLPGTPVPPGRVKKPSEGHPQPKPQPPGLFAVRLAPKP